jgi:hypothetical protein
MLLITKGESKNWFLTLTEKVTIANPKFLFSVTHRQTEKQYNFILADISSFKERYNKFLINENTYQFFEGEYNYVVYAQTSSSNINPSLANELVEEGLLKVQIQDQSEIYYTPS